MHNIRIGIYRATSKFALYRSLHTDRIHIHYIESSELNHNICRFEFIDHKIRTTWTSEGTNSGKIRECSNLYPTFKQYGRVDKLSFKPTPVPRYVLILDHENCKKKKKTN